MDSYNALPTLIPVTHMAPERLSSSKYAVLSSMGGRAWLTGGAEMVGSGLLGS